MIGHAEKAGKVCETVWSFSEIQGVGLEGVDVEGFVSSKGFSSCVNGGFV